MAITRRDVLLSAGWAGRGLGSARKNRPVRSWIRRFLCPISNRWRATTSRTALGSVSGGAADELTLRWNREAYDHIRLKPRVLVDVSKVDTRVKLFGQELPFPILLAPTGAQGFIHPEGDLAAARGAAAAQATW